MKPSIFYLISKVGDVSAVTSTLNNYITPIIASLAGLATLVATGFLIVGGIAYMTSSGRPDKLEHAKKVIRNALIGLVLVLGAGVLTAILVHAYQGSSGNGVSKIPALVKIQPTPVSSGLVAILVDAIVGILKNIIDTAAQPFINALTYFTHGTPLMATNGSVLALWGVMVAMADALFVLVVALLGFHIMSASALGMDEIEFKHLLPQLAVVFLLMNTSIFAIDSIISLSNVMISALYSAFPATTVWSVLDSIVTQSAGLGLVALFILIVFVILSVVLLVYYVMRLVVLYLGAILAPLVILLWLLPSFKDFVSAAAKTYLTTIFVLFVHVTILLLAASIFAGMLNGGPITGLNPLMGAIVGIATLITLLKTQKMMMELSYISVGPKALRKLGGQFVTGVSYISTKAKAVKAGVPE
jgi:hypothetical protein